MRPHSSQVGEVWDVEDSGPVCVGRGADSRQDPGVRSKDSKQLPGPQPPALLQVVCSKTLVSDLRSWCPPRATGH